MFAGVFYGLSFCLLLFAVSTVKRSDTKENLLVYMPVNIMILLCIEGFFASLFFLFKIPVSNVLIGFVNFFVANALILISNKKGRQSYKIEKLEITFYVFFFALVFIICYYRFGRGIFPNFQTIDGAEHFWFAKRIVNYGWSETNLVLSALDEAMWMQSLSFKTGAFDIYKTYILVECGRLFLAASIFVSLIYRHIKSYFMIFSGALISLMYFLGYPFYAFLYGFSYFALSISVIGACIFLCREWMEEKISDGFFYVAEGLLLFGVFICYSLFVPIIFGGIFIAIICKEVSNGKQWSVSILKKELKLFLIPSILGLIRSGYNILYLNIAGSTVESEAGNTAGIAEPGACYPFLSLNIILPGLLAALGIYALLKMKKLYSPIFWVGVFAILMNVLLFIMLKKEAASEYYYSKPASIIWLIAFLLIVEGFSYFNEHKKSFGRYISYIGTVIITCAFIGIYIFPVNLFGYVFNVHAYTKQLYLDTPYYLEQMDLMNYVYYNVSPNTTECITVSEPLFGEWTKRSCEQYRIIQAATPKEIEALINEDTKYILCQYLPEFLAHREEWEAMGEVVYQNQTGEVIEIK